MISRFPPDQLSLIAQHAPTMSLEALQELAPALAGELVQAQKELESRREQELHLEWALCQIADGIAVTDVRGEVRLFNPAFAKLVGCKRGEVDFWSFWQLDGPLKELQKALPQGQDITRQCTLKQGSRVRVTASPIREAQGKLQRWVFTLTEVEESLRLNESLAEQKQLLVNLLDSLQEMVFLVSPQGKPLLDNLAAKTLLADLAPGDAAYLLQTLANLSSEGDSGRLAWSTQRGQRVFLMTRQRIAPGHLLRPDHKEAVILVSLTDVTKLEQTEQLLWAKERYLDLSEIKKRLARTEFAQGVLFRLTSCLHMAKARLNALKALLEGPAMGKAEDLGLELEKIRQELDSFKALPATAETFFGNSQTHDLAQALRLLYQEPMVKSQVQFWVDEPSNPLQFPLNELGMLLLTGILLDNAFDSLEQAPTKEVKLAFFRDERGLNLTVEDSGPGIKPDLQARIFEPLYSTRPDREGLSLTLLHRIIDQKGYGVEVFPSTLGGAGLKMIFPG